ncbi:hypothetical protein LGL08_00140 [Clostridium estertheticum]|nr:hypothetical protein [Clostridium estertheticum]MCB2347979.1 hypothetical protein [Clostridium estertheticum]
MGYYNVFLLQLPLIKKMTSEIEKELSNYDKLLEVYNPFNYGINCYIEYLKKYLVVNDPEYLIIGLNPGVNGAVQTCIPFTDAYNCIHKLGINPCNYI